MKGFLWALAIILLITLLAGGLSGSGKTCSVSSCNKPAYKLGWCEDHYIAASFGILPE